MSSTTESHSLQPALVRRSTQPAPGPSTINEPASSVDRSGRSADELAPFTDEPEPFTDEAALPLPNTTTNRRGIKVTWWRLLNTAIPLTFGIYKYVLSLQGSSTAPTTIDFVLGIIWALIFFWVNQIEAEMPHTWKWFFQVDQKANIRRMVLHLSKFVSRVAKALIRATILSPILSIPPVLFFLSLAVIAKSKAYQKLADTIGRLPFLFMISVLLISAAIIMLVFVSGCMIVNRNVKFLPLQIKRALGVDSNDTWFAWLALTLPLLVYETHYMPKLDYYMQCVVLGVDVFHGGIISATITIVLAKNNRMVGCRILSTLLFLLLLFGGVAVLSLAR